MEILLLNQEKILTDLTLCFLHAAIDFIPNLKDRKMMKRKKRDHRRRGSFLQRGKVGSVGKERSISKIAKFNRARGRRKSLQEKFGTFENFAKGLSNIASTITSHPPVAPMEKSSSPMNSASPSVSSKRKNSAEGYKYSEEDSDSESSLNGFSAEFSINYDATPVSSTVESWGEIS